MKNKYVEKALQSLQLFWGFLFVFFFKKKTALICIPSGFVLFEE